MDKVILLLDGQSGGKTAFIQTIKENNYWTWNVNAYNVIGVIARKLGSDGERNKDYYDFINQVKDLADQYFDFERKNTLSMIEKFMQHDRAMVLILHNVSQDIGIELKDFYQNCFDILVTDTDVEGSSYCKTLNYNDPDFVDNVLHVMNVLTKSFESKKGEE